ncbi:hypothetical protein BpHYR1_007691 [Brachionus plicatilis]|uniref:Uncharacterized protein n=1 Tax=Brachionus plicatilis TaxID=10195 RepID=A0A3M7S969_BRAPC|nr:hypothetical protein BpHYR1_007691 [Brachionus plicatilis]
MTYIKDLYKSHKSRASQDLSFWEHRVLYHVPIDRKFRNHIPLGEKRKRGRTTKAKQALIVQLLKINLKLNNLCLKHYKLSTFKLLLMVTALICPFLLNKVANPLPDFSLYV